MPTYAPPSSLPKPIDPLTSKDQSALASTPARRAWWLRQLMQWHWISSAICLLGMLLFSVTAITLNHPNAIKATPQVHTHHLELEEALLTPLRAAASGMGADAPLPRELRRWLGRELERFVPAVPAEWSDTEIYLALPRPGGDAWLAIDLESGAVEYELTRRGTIAWLNDLHKGRNTGAAWGLFIDVFAVACVVFSLTGFFILWLHARQRPLVWPMLALGGLVPVLIILLFMH